eukprot:TRINITY_DN2962_c6_g1_i1.p1 TRINITY_DN2962_c6_g1~~TRINITY_DN2962_c6_g1_i1.p1  ORF type:complete len:305 (+),score=50.44 TRINITY_DN2962_c6_g1_i1:69-917(+)
MSDWLTAREHAWNCNNGTSKNEESTLQTISIHIDSLRYYSKYCEKLRGSEIEFITNQKEYQDEWEACVRTGSPTPELRVAFRTKVLMNTCGFASKILNYIHAKNSQYRTESVPPLRSSPDDVSDADVTYYCLNILAESLALCCCSTTTNQMQQYFLDEGIINIVCQMATIPREIELARYGEGYRTHIMRVIANATYESHSVTATILETGFVPLILSSTVIDEENAGLREWAEFAIRNITTYPPVVTFIKELKGQRILPESEQELSRAGYRVSNPECPKVSPQ